MRMRSPWQALPVAFYTQWIGEDEAGGLPSKFIGQFGLEIWGSSRFGGLRLRAEYADTACMFARENPEFNCAYRNSIYPQGYTYRGRIIGHSLDNDSRMFSVAGLLTRPNGDVLSVDIAACADQSRRQRHACHQRRAGRPRQCRIALLEGFRLRQSQHRVGIRRSELTWRFGLRRPWFPQLATRILMRKVTVDCVDCVAGWRAFSRRRPRCRPPNRSNSCAA